MREKHLTALLSVLFFCGQSTSGFSQAISSITCPADLVQNIEAGTCGAKVIFPATTDNITNADYSVTYSYSSGAPFPVGTTNVIKQLRDQNGSLISSCSFNVTVIDTEAPVMSDRPANVSVSANSNQCGATVTFNPPNVNESCIRQKKIFFYTGATQYFTVPAGVTSVDVDVTGAAGGHTFYNNSVYGFPGLGGEVFATIPVTPGQVLSLNVGGTGGDGKRNVAGFGGYNGGGNGSSDSFDDAMISFAAGGGGGASDIRVGGAAFADRIIVAGGGGAAGINQDGGDGGGLAGESAKAGNSSLTSESRPATGGTQTEGGKGGSYQNGYFAGDGTEGVGGNGSADLTGGGGGGGLFGGAAGSFGAGAGGSSFAIGGATYVSHKQGAQEGNGFIALTFDQPAILVQTEGLPSGSVFPVGETVNIFTAYDAAGNKSTCTFTVKVTDDQKPVVTAASNQIFSTVATSYTVPAFTVTDNCGVSSISYTVTGATTRSGTGTDASGSFNSGTSSINYTATDMHGNVQTAMTTITVNATPIAGSIADVWAVAPWGNANTIYLGFGPANLTLNATAVGGTSPLAFSWKKDGSSTVLSTFGSLMVSSPGLYTATVTDKNGAQGIISKEIKMEDLRCGDNDDKVAICHTSTGNGDKTRTICVSKSSVDKFLGSGNYLGNCIQARIAAVVEPEVLVTVPTRFNVYPNPASKQFTVQLNNFKTGKAEVVLLSSNGMTVQRRIVELKAVNETITYNIGNLAPGIYILKVVSDAGTQTSKVILQ